MSSIAEAAEIKSGAYRSKVYKESQSGRGYSLWWRNNGTVAEVEYLLVYNAACITFCSLNFDSKSTVRRPVMASNFMQFLYLTNRASDSVDHPVAGFSVSRFRSGRSVTIPAPVVLPRIV